MYGLKKQDGTIVDVTEITPTITAQNILFNKCLYTQIDVLSVVSDVPDYVKAQRFKLTGADFVPILENMNAYENLLMQTAIDDYTLQLINGGVL